MDIYAEEEIELDDMDNWTKEDYCSKNIGIELVPFKKLVFNKKMSKYYPIDKIS